MGGSITSCSAMLPPSAGTMPGVISGGGAAAPPAPDLGAAIARLQEAVAGLQAVVDALRSAQQVSGGGPGAVGCGCSGGMATPVQQSISLGAPDAAAPPAPVNGPGDSPPPAGGVRDRIVAIAREELARGVKEDAGSDRDKAGHIRKYRTAVTGPGENPDAAEPWCADFASWVWKQAGVPFGKNGQGEDYTVAMIDWAKSQNRWHPRSGADPKPGDLILFDWQRGSDVDHVAVVEKVENGRVYTIGGNESDSVKAQSYALGDTRIMGYIPPAGG